MPSCREVAGLVGGDRLERGPWWRRLGVAAHLAMCAHCARFARQMAAVTEAFREQLSRPPQGTESLRRRILERLGRL